MPFETVTGYCWPQSVAAGEQVGLHLSSAGGSTGLGRDRPGRRRAHGRASPTRPSRPTTTPPRPTHRRPAAAGRRRSRSTSTRRGARATTRWSSRSTSTAGPDAATPSSSCARRRRVDRRTILLALATNTWHAYNDFGGRNLYNGGTSRLAAAADEPRLPVQAAGPRPPGHRRRRAGSADGGPRRLPHAQPPVAVGRLGGLARLGAAVPAVGRAGGLRHRRRHQRRPRSTTPSCSGRTARYRLFLSVGHDEYWSARCATPSRASSAGAATRRSSRATPSFWQVRLEDATPEGPAATMVGYKG